MIFHGSVGQRFLVEGLHNGNSGAHHSSTKMLDDVETIKDNFSLWKKFPNKENVCARHVYCDHFDLFPSLSGILVEMLFDGRLAVVF